MLRKIPVSQHVPSIRPRAANTLRSSVLMAIEPRVLFDGAGLASVDAEMNTRAIEHSFEQRTLDVSVKPISVDPTALPASIQKLPELVVIDPNVKDWQLLAAGVSPNAQLLILDAQSDALMQIAHVMSEGGQYSAVHLATMAVTSWGSVPPLVSHSTTQRAPASNAVLATLSA